MRLVAFVLAPFTACLVAGCLGTGDIAIRVRGSVVDRESQPYERCEVSLYRGASEELLASDVVKGGSIDTWFTVRSLWKGVEVGVRCEGASKQYRSGRIGWAHENPADLGRIELPRSEE